ncbi:MAG TPA: efflux RND transporter periplasmic adaptor subunit [Burkholderiales bacterium]|nr:efflux RND transporter periplasmic adaptor subunit [Burkholderiales bacterium]
MLPVGRACIVSLAILLAACGKEAEQTRGATGSTAKAAGGGVQLADVSRKFLVIEPLAASENSQGRKYFGRTAFRPKALSVVTAPFSGRVVAIAVEPGQIVKSGATLFTIESADVLGLRSTLSQSRLKARLADEVLARQNEMVKRGVGLEVERFEAEMKAREAHGELERAERNAALAGGGQGTRVDVRATVEGVVVSVKAAPGAMVQPGGDALVEIGNPRGLWIVADVPEGEVEQVAKATKAEVTIAALNQVLPGRVAGIAPRSDAETRRTPFYVELDETPEGLRAGLLVRVAVFAPVTEGELWLPVTAVLLKDGSRRVVYVEDSTGRFIAREIEVGDERGGRVRVLKGVRAGERVVMKGALLVDREAEQLL